MFASLSYSKLREKYLSLSAREQLLLVIVAGATLYFLMDFVVFAAQNRREQDMTNNQRALQSQVAVLVAEIAAVDQVTDSQLAQNEQEYAQLKKQAALLESLVQSVATEAPKVREVVDNLLRAQRVNTAGVRTIPVKALPVQVGGGVAAQPAGDNKGAAPSTGVAVYKHGVDIELRGRYLDLMAYLRGLEEATPNLFWANASLTTGEYPESIVRTSVFLLSTRSNL
jgi:MSHA biogenesis protein MshJ